MSNEEIRLTGKVKFYDVRKGYGFIQVVDDKDYFFHITGLTHDWIPKTDDAVIFGIGDNRKGICAVNVDKVE